MNSVIDFHSHILCGVDHGTGSRKESKAQIEMMSRAGTSLAVATSHFYPERHTVDSFRQAVRTAQEKLATVTFDCAPVELCIGAEILVCHGLESIDGLDRLCIRGTNILLLEMPTAQNWQHGAMGAVERIIDMGYTAVLAHIDRYIGKHERDIDELLSLGALAQINASAISSFFLKRKMLSYIDGGYVCALGSDLHGTDPKAYKDFSALRSKLGDERFSGIMQKSARLLENAERFSVNT